MDILNIRDNKMIHSLFTPSGRIKVNNTWIRGESHIDFRGKA